MYRQTGSECRGRVPRWQVRHGEEAGLVETALSVAALLRVHCVDAGRDYNCRLGVLHHCVQPGLRQEQVGGVVIGPAVLVRRVCLPRATIQGIGFANFIFKPFISP